MPRLETIDRMRGVAILLVLVYHAGPNEWRLPPYDADGFVRLPALGLYWLAAPLFHFGFVGVHCFFVLSGFCIHLREARRRYEPSIPPLSLRGFFLRRLVRIYPPYWIALVLFGVAWPLAARWAAPSSSVVQPPLASASDLLLHASMLHGFFERTIFSINPAFWSLATEEQFYLAYPLLLVGMARFGVARILVAALLLSLTWRSVVLGALPPDVSHFMTYRVWLHGFFLPRWYEWILGCLVAEAAADPDAPLASKVRPLRALALVLLACGVLCRVHVAIDKLLADTFFSTGFAALIASELGRAMRRGATISPTGIAGRAALHVSFAFAAALAWVGRRAYGIYLVHQPILDGVDGLLFGISSRFLRLPIAVAAGVVYSAIGERPFERLAQRVGQPRVPPVVGLAEPNLDETMDDASGRA